jgi:uncharacterized protein YdeI (YjbR/CyaY-like superfamily)
MAKDKRIDAYITQAAPFARPVLKHLRRLVHAACPGVTETIKWGMPAFEYQGPLLGMAAFKAHCVAGFRKSGLMNDPHGYLGKRAAQGGEAMGNLGRITSLDDLPPDGVLLDFIRQAVRLNETGVKVPRTAAKPEPPVIPAELKTALAKNPKAKKTFEAFSPSHRREYAGWIREAKTEATRKKRVDTTVSWLLEGKTRNWKYARKTGAAKTKA